MLLPCIVLALGRTSSSDQLIKHCLQRPVETKHRMHFDEEGWLELSFGAQGAAEGRVGRGCVVVGGRLAWRGGQEVMFLRHSWKTSWVFPPSPKDTDMLELGFMKPNTILPT